MSSPIVPEYRLRNFARALRELLLGRRLSADADKTGVVDLADFGKRCRKTAELAGKTLEDLEGQEGTLRRVADEMELACRLAALMETLPDKRERIDKQCTVLEETERLVAAAIGAEGQLEEEPAIVSLSALARKEKDVFAPFRTFLGRIHDAQPSLVLRGVVLRALRRALLDHEGDEPFRLDVDRGGVLRFLTLEFSGESAGETLPRSSAEPPEVRKALDLREATQDEALRDFLLVKAVDEALAAFLTPHLKDPEFVEKARAFPRKPGKRGGIRPEAVRATVAGWSEADAARAIGKVADRRIGPDGARLPRGAYLLRLLLHEDDRLAADLLALGPVLRRMEKGEPVESVEDRALRALKGLLGLLG